MLQVTNKITRIMYWLSSKMKKSSVLHRLIIGLHEKSVFLTEGLGKFSFTTEREQFY